MPKKRVSPKMNEDGDPKRSDTINQIPCMEFTFFQKLPPELRIEVWKISMRPRLVVLEPNGKWCNSRSDFTKKIFPAYLSVNCEARDCALRHYSLRVTITVAVDTRRYQNLNYYPRYHANAIMSPDDTLGFLGWENFANSRRYGWKFQVDNANSSGPWASNRPDASLCGIQQQVNKVAFLTSNFRSNSKIIDELNSTVSWDVRSILHTKSDKLRKLSPPGASWYEIGNPHYIKDHVLMHSRNFSGSLQEWGERLLHRFNNDGLLHLTGLPDILAFELGKQPDTMPAPPPALLMGSAYPSAEELYFWGEWRWLQSHPCSQGF
ncbi:hypothetical protein DHEL01_v205978 [Diaporthe helianthi]|uniref:2EXR domain-containing protein n=1 Tax=Diaporthe helianthi TaxID=158607 RepID=A0A2P5HZH3_DIAHE|nr:hypothetical protein DHEL01_v205978 [Diaporthe helianthi]